MKKEGKRNRGREEERKRKKERKNKLGSSFGHLLRRCLSFRHTHMKQIYLESGLELSKSPGGKKEVPQNVIQRYAKCTEVIREIAEKKSPQGSFSSIQRMAWKAVGIIKKKTNIVLQIIF